MFTLKVYSATQHPAVPCYRHIAATEYEIGPPKDPVYWATLVLINFDGTVWEWGLRPGEYVFVENAAGTTIGRLRELHIRPRAEDPDPEYLRREQLMGDVCSSSVPADGPPTTATRVNEDGTAYQRQ